MGTIGHHTLLHELKNWQIRAALRGYYRQQRTAWETARFTSFVTACAFGGDRIKTPEDLLPLPWDRKQHTEVSEEDVQHCLDLINEENAKLQSAPRHASESGTIKSDSQ